MKHILRLNVFGKGYTLISGEPPTYKEYSLGLESDGISNNYLSAESRIDNMLETHLSRWKFCVVNLDLNELPVVAYGCLLAIEDEYNRTGVSFIHAIESENPVQIDEIAICIIKSLSNQNILKINQVLRGLAQGNQTLDETFKFLTANFKKISSQKNSFLTQSGEPIKEITHDCGGSSAVAWLGMTRSHLNYPPPWEIYDLYSSQTGFFSTVSSLTMVSTSFFLSQYLDEQIPKLRSMIGANGAKTVESQRIIPSSTSLKEINKNAISSNDESINSQKIDTKKIVTNKINKHILFNNLHMPKNTFNWNKNSKILCFILAVFLLTALIILFQGSIYQYFFYLNKIKITPKPIIGRVDFTQTPNSAVNLLLQNEQFQVKHNTRGMTLGDGIDEVTIWNFDLSSVNTVDRLAHATLTLDLTPKHRGVTTDSLKIENLPDITPNEMRNLPIGETSTITIQLEDYYDPKEIVNAINHVINNRGGVLVMHYQDDAVISRAELVLQILAK